MPGFVIHEVEDGRRRATGLAIALAERVVVVAGVRAGRRQAAGLHAAAVVIGVNGRARASRVADGVVAVRACERAGRRAQLIRSRAHRVRARGRAGLREAIAVCIVRVADRGAALRGRAQPIEQVVAQSPGVRGRRDVVGRGDAEGIVVTQRALTRARDLCELAVGVERARGRGAVAPAPSSDRTERVVGDVVEDRDGGRAQRSELLKFELG